MVAVNGARVKQGFRLPERTARMTFEGTDYDGAEIQVRLSVTFSQFLSLRQTAENDDQENMARLFGDLVLMTWNLEDVDGNPLPATGEGMMDIPLPLTNLVLQHWVEEVTRVSGPLAEPSSDINTLAGASTALAIE